MINRSTTAIAMMVTALFVFQPQNANAQLFKKIQDAAERGVKRAAEREAERRADQATTEAIDAVVCAVTDTVCIRDARNQGRSVTVTDASGRPLSPDEQASAMAGADDASALRPGEGVWANYDFVPGNRALFVEHFEDEYVGDVPRRLGFLRGNMETVEWQGRQLLRLTSDSAFTLDLPETLPTRFTIEFDLYATDYWQSLCLATGPLGGRDEPFTCFQGRAKNYDSAFFTVADYFKTGLRGGSGGESTARQSRTQNSLTPVRIIADGQYVKMFLGETRVVNVPNADLARGQQIHIFVGGEVTQAQPVYLDNLRVAAGGREILYERLVADGRYSTQGILFATGSATLRPESTPTLKEIARTLDRHQDLRLRIEGHTDNTGSEATNRALSEARAAAVREHLVHTYGIAAERLETEGFGPSRPVAQNNTPEGRESNRRVELVKL